jgi:subtilisin family serine protease
MNKANSLSLFFSLLLSLSIQSQTDWVIQLKDDATVQSLQSGWLKSGLRSSATDMTTKYIAPHFNILTLHCNTTVTKSELLKNPSIQFAEINAPLESRATPNDPLLAQQWHLNNISAPKAWDQVTGGLTFNKDTVVMGFIDLGILTTHEDLKNRIWVNRAEIAGNGKDDDGNGYVDDVNGLSLKYKNERQTVDNSTDGLGNHGTSVAGLMAGESNNKLGIAGMMWNSKLMVTTFSSSPNVGDLIECFNYILDQRIKYNQSNGKQGALVVTVNYSGGISFAFAADYPIWCGMYDKMGAAGILNCGATTNKLVDVEDQGDMPSTCPSEFLIAVTNTGQDNKRVTTSGYGVKSIDLGSPGEGVMSTNSSSNTGYSAFTGTSAATPIVAGCVGLMYSYPCKQWSDYIKSNPVEAARMVKRSLLVSVDKNADLTGTTVSGGRLNIARAMDTLKKYVCNGGVIAGTSDQLLIRSIYPNPAQRYLQIQLDDNESGTYAVELMDVLGRVEIRLPSVLINHFYQLSIPELSDGMYILKLDGNGKQVSKKILIKN